MADWNPTWWDHKKKKISSSFKRINTTKKEAGLKWKQKALSHSSVLSFEQSFFSSPPRPSASPSLDKQKKKKKVFCYALNRIPRAASSLSQVFFRFRLLCGLLWCVFLFKVHPCRRQTFSVRCGRPNRQSISKDAFIPNLGLQKKVMCMQWEGSFLFDIISPPEFMLKGMEQVETPMHV